MRRGRSFPALGAFLLICACGPGGLDTPPASIEGLWTTTDDPRYADRAFEITEEFLYLLQGGDTFSVYRINEVQLAEDDLPRYTIEYRGEEGELAEFRVFLSQEGGGTLLFPNQTHMKWQRDPDASVPWRAIR